MVLDTDFKITMPNIFNEFKAKMENSDNQLETTFKRRKYTKKIQWIQFLNQWEVWTPN